MMCFGMCQNEIQTGKNIGQCGGGICPPDGDICAGCGCEVETRNFCRECEDFYQVMYDFSMEEI